MDLDPVARHFRSFGRTAAPESPLYARLSELIVERPDLLALAAQSPDGTPMAFLAAVHHELLRDPDHALAAYYPTTGGAGPGPGLGAAFSAFCGDRAERLATTLATRRTQTNEVARVTADDQCELVGPHVPPLDPPPVAWRVGVDLSPVDASDPDDARWLRACLWPDMPARQERLAAALTVAREHPVEVRRGDALTALPGLIAEAPADALVCVFHTATLIYFAHEQIEALGALDGRCRGRRVRGSWDRPSPRGSCAGSARRRRRARSGRA